MFRYITPALTMMCVCFAATAAFAATAGGGGGLPWDAPLTTLQTDLTGTTATAISLIGIVAVFGVLIFGGELNHFFRTLCYIILLVSVLVAGQNVLTALGITGATVDGGIGREVYGFISGVAITTLIFLVGMRIRRRRRIRQQEMDASVVSNLAAPR